MEFPGFASDKEPTCHSRRLKGCRFGPFQEDHLEEGMAAHSSILPWRIPWTEEPGGATVHGVAKSRTRLKQHSMHAWAVMKLLSVICSLMSLLLFLS